MHYFENILKDRKTYANYTNLQTSKTDNSTHFSQMSHLYIINLRFSDVFRGYRNVKLD